MASKVDFGTLLEAAGSGDAGKLEKKRPALETARGKMQDELAKVQTELRQVEQDLMAPVRSAVTAAKALGIDIPEEYQNLRVNGGRNGGNRSSGKYEWTSNGMATRRAEPSRALWSLSRGSEGSAGDDGRLKVDEFWALVQEQAGKTEADIGLGDEVTITLPNGREITMKKVEE